MQLVVIRTLAFPARTGQSGLSCCWAFAAKCRLIDTLSKNAQDPETKGVCTPKKVCFAILPKACASAIDVSPRSFSADRMHVYHLMCLEWFRTLDNLPQRPPPQCILLTRSSHSPTVICFCQASLSWTMSRRRPLWQLLAPVALIGSAEALGKLT